MNIDVPSAGNPCGTVSGDVFLDHDQDCVQDAIDEPIPYRVLEVLPGPEYAITDADGHYALGLAYGNFTIDHQGDGGFDQLCPPAQQQPFTINGVTSDVVVDFADSSLTPLDVIASLYSTPIRPGFQAGYSAYVTNNSGQLSGPVEATFTIPAPLTYVSAVPVPTSVVGNTVTWTGLPALGAYDQHYLHITVQVPPDPLLIGTFVTATLSASQPIAESDLVNNSIDLTREITGSYDPNDKRARTSSGWSDALYYIGTDEWVEYVIRFQNTGNDTAFTVVVTDTLSEELDMASFQQGVASHAFSVSFKPDRVIEWRFEDIDLPDSTTNWVASNGFVSFRIRPALPIAPGTVIENTANIYFDFNPPVITEPSVLVAEFSTGVQGQSQDDMRLLPNPVNDQLLISSDGTIDMITIIAADGREVMRRRMRTTSGTIDVSGLRAGSFFLVAILENGGIVHERFIKQ
ncbi:MAG: T9SS type A sorting domain-containing protein [Flavobacteriales bacterium]|nr:T9SS type A sorting domain-containing protein [Flavobacteriales bacterium]